MPKNDFERRNFTVEGLKIEKREEGEPQKIVGHAIVYGAVADIGGSFQEQVMPGAFSDAIKQDDVRALFNHDSNYVLGRTKAGTLNLYEDERGLLVEILPPETQFAKDLMVSIQRGDISQMSFGFNCIEDQWEHKDGVNVRTITKLALFDVSPVTFPAYVETDVAVRSLQRFQEQGCDVSEAWKIDLMRKRQDLLESE